MDSHVPTRITIELEERGARRGGWRARARIEGRRASSGEVAPSIAVVDQPSADWTPTPYEPGPCTCEDGLCDRDHEHE